MLIQLRLHDLRWFHTKIDDLTLITFRLDAGSEGCRDTPCASGRTKYQLMYFHLSTMIMVFVCSSNR